MKELFSGDLIFRTRFSPASFLFQIFRRTDLVGRRWQAWISDSEIVMSYFSCTRLIIWDCIVIFSLLSYSSVLIKEIFPWVWFGKLETITNTLETSLSNFVNLISLPSNLGFLFFLCRFNLVYIAGNSWCRLSHRVATVTLFTTIHDTKSLGVRVSSRRTSFTSCFLTRSFSSHIEQVQF